MKMKLRNNFVINVYGAIALVCTMFIQNNVYASASINISDKYEPSLFENLFQEVKVLYSEHNIAGAVEKLAAFQGDGEYLSRRLLEGIIDVYGYTEIGVEYPLELATLKGKLESRDAVILTFLGSVNGFCYWENKDSIVLIEDPTKFYLNEWLSASSPDHFLYASKIRYAGYQHKNGVVRDDIDFEKAYSKGQFLLNDLGISEVDIYLRRIMVEIDKNKM